MEEAKRLGLTKSIGVSNFNIPQLERLLNSSKTVPAMNQVEVKIIKIFRLYYNSFPSGFFASGSFLVAFAQFVVNICRVLALCKQTRHWEDEKPCKCDLHTVRSNVLFPGESQLYPEEADSVLQAARNRDHRLHTARVHAGAASHGQGRSGTQVG